MKTPRYRVRWVLGMALAGVLGMSAGQAQLIVDLDMDPGVAGIQTSRSANVGDTFTVDVWLTLPPGSTGLTSYSLSIRFDNTELNLNGVPATTEIDPDGVGGWAINGGPAAEKNDIGGGLGQVSAFGATDWSFPAAPFAAPKSWVAASINFKVVGVFDDGLPDITPGQFHILDGFSDAAYNNINNVTFNTGLLVPEPAATGLVLGAAALLGSLLLRRLQSASG